MSCHGPWCGILIKHKNYKDLGPMIFHYLRLFFFVLIDVRVDVGVRPEDVYKIYISVQAIFKFQQYILLEIM